VYFPVECYPARAPLRAGAIEARTKAIYPFGLSVEIRIILEFNPNRYPECSDRRLCSASTRNSFKYAVIVCPVACRFYTEPSIRLNFSVDIGGLPA
jgi:hypothetical protein